jgi:hypothetical protein
MSLYTRIQAFDELCSRFPCARPSPLIAAHRVPAPALQRLRHATAVYMSRCLPDGCLVLDEEALLAAFTERHADIRNITPNGMIVPKRHTILEYNALVRAFADIVDALNIQDLILSWHVPLNLRIKLSRASEDNLLRHHPTEHIHSDSWAGESSESVTTHIPIFGDIERNHLVFYDPPDTFQEDWLRPLPTYRDGESIARQYRRLDFHPSKGELILADFASLHASHRLPDAGPRVSIDTTFAMKRPHANRKGETIHPWRVEERAAHSVLARLGETHLFVFPDSVDAQVDSQGGFKHPTNLRVVELLGSAECGVRSAE